MTPGVFPAVFQGYLSDVRFRMALADSPHTPALWLEVLAEDPAQEVRLLVAGNPHTPEQALRGLVHETTLHLKLAGNPGTPLDVLEALAAQGNQDVRDRLSENPASPATLLRSVFQHLSHAALHHLYRHPNCPADLQQHLLALHPHWKHHQSTLRGPSERPILPEPCQPPFTCGCTGQERTTDHETPPVAAVVAPPGGAHLP
ncbi:DUF2336 domain-containing protein [Deinococcus cellulosilyticus]|uniref:Leucine rich repeat variant n=1 Tax=Deinococcus cellulosilyticus (strain DSM 18568 / NBRC 106333 / KACC 11606 / 5516J-15) TaxID=1223518 RepID=A0A511N1B8_DEIC1|nr:DUF2336 domain-containing protein [Deinococcus cellulosilyticus]GEM46680.1 hypothetical protein DC3_23150 [Deinococcus cellulosilyticus NBRC 106333 = KACC 11606]